MKHVFLTLLLAFGISSARAQEPTLQIDTKWEYVADTVMGGVSSGQIQTTHIDGRDATQLTGLVSLDNGGGFVQMAIDLGTNGKTFDASNYRGIKITFKGNNETYDLRLRTDQLKRPWHSFRTEITATPQWQTLEIPFELFVPHRTDLSLDTSRLRRFGVLAIGRVFEANIAVSNVAFY
jgi:hypothetical protein